MKNRCCKFRFLIPFIILGVAALLALAVRGLWNGVLTDVLDVKAITYWQALGILVLARILFGGFPCRRGDGFGPPRWVRHRMMRHWQSLTPEQQEKMREKMRARFGDWPRPCCGGEEAEPEKPGEGPKA
jgi:hypothetical protein